MLALRADSSSSSKPFAAGRGFARSPRPILATGRRRRRGAVAADQGVQTTTQPRFLLHKVPSSPCSTRNAGSIRRRHISRSAARATTGVSAMRHQNLPVLAFDHHGKEVPPSRTSVRAGDVIRGGIDQEAGCRGQFPPAGPAGPSGNAAAARFSTSSGEDTSVRRACRSIRDRRMLTRMRCLHQLHGRRAGHLIQGGLGHVVGHATTGSRPWHGRS